MNDLPSRLASLRSFTSRTLRVLLMAMALGTTGAHCSTPTMRVDHAEVSGFSLGGIIVNVVVEVNNTHSFDIQVQNVRAQVTVGNVGPIPVAYNPNQWLASNGKTMMAIPVTIPWPMVPGMLSTTVGADSLKYHVDGKADIVASRTFAMTSKDESVTQDGTIPRALVVNAARTTIPGAY